MVRGVCASMSYTWTEKLPRERSNPPHLTLDPSSTPHPPPLASHLHHAARRHALAEDQVPHAQHSHGGLPCVEDSAHLCVCVCVCVCVYVPQDSA